MFGYGQIHDKNLITQFDVEVFQPRVNNNNNKNNKTKR